MSLAPDEQKTIIRWDNKYKKVEVYTCDQALIKRLDTACEEAPQDWTKEREDSEHGRVISAEYTGTSKGLIRIRSKRLKQNLTQKQLFA